MKIGFTAGAFDLVHAGHCLHFEECKKHCDYLIVGLQVDPSVDRKKNKPVMSVKERLIMLEANKFVDKIEIYRTEKELHELDLDLPIDVRFMGADHKGKKHHKTAQVVYTSRKHNYSSTELRKRIYEAEANRHTGKSGGKAYCG